jgi:hypothetical protein
MRRECDAACDASSCGSLTFRLQAAVGLITNAYDLASLFDPTGFVSETPMVAFGDAVAVIVGIASIIPLAIQGQPPAGAPWSGDYSRAFGLLIVFM